ncbi:MAG TPA: transaldolase family protein, partial [Nevskiaceae bacterium]|nr:transaldolase family protein [Nevskiaceae bacterium]
HCVCSLFISRWDQATAALPDGLRNRVGIAIGRRCRAELETCNPQRWRRVTAAGGHAPRLVFASTGTKDPAASDVLYVEALIAAGTITTVPEETLLAFARHGSARLHTGDEDEVLARMAQHGCVLDRLAAQLQQQGCESFTDAWRKLLTAVANKGAAATG